MWKIVSICALFLSISPCSLLADEEDAGAVRDAYTVQQVSGVVLTRSTTGAQWQRVAKGDLLPEGQIIQVTRRATVTLETSASGRVSHLSGDRMQIGITQPIVTRLSRDILRNVSLSSIFVERSNQRLPRDLFDNDPFTWADAWKRLAAFVTNVPEQGPKLEEFSELERKGVTVGVSAKPIRIVSPVSNTVLQSAEWPAELKVVWQRVKGKNLTYHVYLWRHGVKRHRAVAETKTDYHTIRIPAPGTYFVQVTSKDQTWQSAPRSVYVVGPLNSDMMTSDPVGSAQPQHQVTLLHPPDDGVLAVDQKHAVSFGWRLRDIDLNAADSETFVLSVFDGNDKPVKDVTTSATSASLVLPPGNYSWQVRSRQGTPVSGRHRFQVLSGARVATERDRRALLKGFFAAETNAVLILEDGL